MINLREVGNTRIVNLTREDADEIQDRIEEQQAQVDALETALVDNWCYENEELDALLDRIKGGE